MRGHFDIIVVTQGRRRALDGLLSVGLVVAVGAYALVLVGGRILNLHIDEMYFLHRAYALEQGWLAVFSPSRAYTVYTHWLSLGIAVDEPRSLWNAILIDTTAQLLCLALLTWLGTRLQRPRSWLGFWFVLAGVLFYFTAGRLAETRPDYLAVTLLFIGMLCLLQGFLEAKPSTRSGLVALAGLCLAASVSVSPRALIVLGIALPLMTPYLVTRWGLATSFRLFGFGIVGLVAIAALIWVGSGYALPQGVTGMVESFLRRDGTGCCLSLEERFFDRKVPVAVNLGVLLAAVAAFALNRDDRSRLFALTAACLALGQFGLIVIDAQIYEYGYSYGLSAFLLMTIAVMGSGDNAVRGMHGLPRLVATGFLLIHLAQLPLIARSHGYIHHRTFELHTSVTAEDRLRRVTRASVRGPHLVPQLRAKILLCERLPGYLYVGKVHDNPICLQNGYRLLPAPYAIAGETDSRFEFPVRKAQVARLVTALDLPKDSVGVLYRPGADGDVDDWIPLR